MSLIDRGRFIGGERRGYLSTAGEGLVPASVIDATRSYYERKVDPVRGRELHLDVDREVKVRLAGLMSAGPGDIALLSNASQGISAIYSLIDWRPGDNVVLMTNDLEFPSVVIPAFQRMRRGDLEIRVVDRGGWVVTPEQIAAAVDERTRLVFASHVSYRTGYRLDLERLRDLLGDSRALLAVDATQSLGVVPVPAPACDFLVATSCKWLLAPHGVGVFYWNRERRPGVEPHDIGWYSVVDDLQFPYDLKPDAGRFELGSPDWPAIYALNEGLKVLGEAGLEQIERHVLGLGAQLLDGLSEFDLEIMTPREPELRAGIVSWLDPDNAATAATLAEREVYVTGSSGRIRVAFHLYNDAADIERLLESLSEIRR